MSMKVFVDIGYDHPLIVRIMPDLKAMGVELQPTNSIDCRVHYSHVEYRDLSSFMPRPKVLRLDGCFYNTHDLQFNTTLKYSYGISTHVIFQSEYSKRLCENIFRAPKIIPSTVIYNAGITADWGRPIAHKDFNIVCCAKWRRWKRLPEIIEIFKSIPFPSKLHIVGESGESTDNIKYYGSVDYNSMGKIFSLMDAAIHIAKRDPCPNSVIEFISVGIPVIVSDKGGGATELALMTPGCHIAIGDRDSNDVGMIEQYSEDWNMITREFRDNVIRLLSGIYNGGRHPRPRVKLPDILKPKYVAEQYAKVLKGV